MELIVFSSINPAHVGQSHTADLIPMIRWWVLWESLTALDEFKNIFYMTTSEHQLEPVLFQKYCKGISFWIHLHGRTFFGAAIFCPWGCSYPILSGAGIESSNSIYGTWAMPGTLAHENLDFHGSEEGRHSSSNSSSAAALRVPLVFCQVLTSESTSWRNAAVECQQSPSGGCKAWSSLKAQVVVGCDLQSLTWVRTGQ